jgi:hypothetical protein
VLGCEGKQVLYPQQPGPRPTPSAPPQPAKAPATLSPERRVDYTCKACARSFKAKVGKLLDDLRRNRAQCMVCGGELLLPSGVREAFQAQLQAGAVVQDEVMSCVFCARDMTAAPVSREELQTCKTCGVDFRPPLQPGGSSRMPPLEGERASFSDLSELEGFFDLDVVGQILEVRALLGELALADAEAVVSNLARIQSDAPSPDGGLRLPVGPAEARALAGPMLFPGLPPREDPDTGELVFVLDRSVSWTSLANLSNAVDLAMFLATGAHPLEQGAAPLQEELRLRLSFLPAGEGTLLGVALQRSAGGDRKPAPASLLKALGELLDLQRPVLEAYFGLRALFGDLAQGPRAFAITKPAVKARLDLLGGALAGQSARLAARLCPTAVAAEVLPRRRA